MTRQSGLAYRTVYQIWHNYTERPDKKTLERLAQTLGVRPQELITDDTEQEEA
ncbi:MAG: helix-turn-helix domain-containing protein [Phycisphaerales bacterium]|nr:helix-turn-helix domain-containing protein [Phycisphaerales bacterium]